MRKDFFGRGIDKVISEESLRARLEKGDKLRIKYGVDPTRPDIHLGHAVVLWKLKELQDDGHTIIFLIGDYTTKIGDPSGRNTTRPILSDEEIKENAKTYLSQVGKILNVEKTEVRYNSEWLSKLTFNDVLLLAGKFTVAQIIEREDFRKRLEDGSDIALHEMLYPLMQAYDSVALEADVEFGGSDQIFNLLAGRDLQKKVGQRPQDIVTTRLLVGTDGKIKMSKSAGNYISVNEEPNTMYGKVMSVPDSLIVPYFELCTGKNEDEIASIKSTLDAGQNPRGAKMALAREIVSIYHSPEDSLKAEEEFVRVFSNKELPTDLAPVELAEGNYEPPMLLIALGATNSKSEARRLVVQGGLKVDGAKVSDPSSVIAIRDGMILQVGKKKAYKVTAD
ncbi:MAG: tyrosine--tRNA ligase [Patescibacteria group bacterium]|jgi:tyrosyl-tRNA synthetase